MIKSTDYASVITEDLMLYGAEDTYRELITQKIIPMINEEGEIVPFEQIGHVRKPSLMNFTGKFATMKNELDAIFEENNRNCTDPEVFAIVKRYFDMLECNKTVHIPPKKDWKDLFNRIQESPTIEDCIKFDDNASRSEDSELIATAMDVDTKARKLFGDDYLTKNNQVEEPFVVEWDG
ncbi:MAG: hypothetical protein MJZ37_07020 [Bacilli bacterium]|nr:hypothetical protein [Bacilli bacterium]